MSEESMMRQFEKAKRLTTRMFNNAGYRIDNLEFCILAARHAEYRFVVIGMKDSFEKIWHQNAIRLMRWPDCHNGCVQKELWIWDYEHKEFDKFICQGGKWVDNLGRQFILDARIPKNKKPPRIKLGCVYFIFSPNEHIVKIGKTENIEARLKQFQLHAPSFKLLGTIDTDDPMRLEREIHKKFNRYKVQGEWFKYNQELQKYIEELTECPRIP